MVRFWEIISAFILFLPCVTRGILQTRYAVKMHMLNDTYFFTHQLWKIERRNTIDCLNLCMTRKDCASFSVNTISRLCQGFFSIFQSIPESGTHEPGWMHYEMNCEPGWGKYDNHCYLFWNKAKTWHEAKDECEIVGGTLLKIDSAEENKWIESRIAENNLNFPHAWIGANDLDGDGTWTWLDGAPVLPLWKSNEPSGDGQCVCFMMYKDWNDYPCQATSRFICEKKLF